MPKKGKPPKGKDLRKAAEEQWYKHWVEHIWDGIEPTGFTLAPRAGGRRSTGGSC